MTKATRDTTKLNFITDQGSTRATVRCACLAWRLDDRLDLPRTGSVARSAGVVAEPTAAAAAPMPAAVLVSPLERRKFRAGDDGGTGAGPGVSQANAAAETVPGGGSVADGAVGDSPGADGSVVDAAWSGVLLLNDPGYGSARADAPLAREPSGDSSPS
jgi:hypothetical protein